MWKTFVPARKLLRSGKYLLLALLLCCALLTYLQFAATNDMDTIKTSGYIDTLGIRARREPLRVWHMDAESDESWKTHTSPTWSSEYQGQANLHIFEDWCGSSVQQLRKNLHYPLYPHSRSTISKLAIAPKWTNYGLRIFGYLHPYTDGEFVFAVGSDDNCEFWLSSDESPNNIQLLAAVGKTGKEWSAPGEFGKYACQMSEPVPLLMKQRYFFELIHKQDDKGTDHVEVAWRLNKADLEFAVVDSQHISLYTNESSLKMSDVAHIPQTMASHVTPPSKRPQATPHGADMLQEDPRDTFYQLPLINPLDLKNILPDCPYNPSYTIKDFPLSRYQGLQFVYLSYVYPNDYTRLTHMEEDNKCFYKSVYHPRLGFAWNMNLDGVDRDSDLKHSELDWGESRAREIDREINGNEIPDYGDDYDDYAHHRQRKLFSLNRKNIPPLEHQVPAGQLENLPKNKSSRPRGNPASQPKKPPEHSKNISKEGQNLDGEGNNQLRKPQNSIENQQGNEHPVPEQEPVRAPPKYVPLPIREEQNPPKDPHLPIKADRNLLKEGQLPIRGAQDPPKAAHNPIRGDQNPPKEAHHPIRGAQDPSEEAHLPIRGTQDPPKEAYHPIRGDRNPPKEGHIPVRGPQDQLNQKQEVDEDSNRALPKIDLRDKQDWQDKLDRNQNKLYVETARKDKLSLIDGEIANDINKHSKQIQLQAAPPPLVAGNSVHGKEEEAEPEEGDAPDGNGTNEEYDDTDQWQKWDDWEEQVPYDPEVNWAQTFQLNPMDLHKIRSDWIDLNCNVSGNLLLSQPDALRAVQAFMEKLNRKTQKQYTLVQVVNVEKRVDVMHGSRYLLELELLDAKGHQVRVSQYVYLLPGRQGYIHGSQEPLLCNPVGFQWNPRATVHFIVPVKNQARWVQQFISDMEELYEATGDQNFNIIITDYESTDMDILQSLQNASLPSYQYVRLNGNFERAAGLQTGIELIKDEHSIVFLCDLHIHFPMGFVDSVRKHCVEGKMAFAPVVMRLNCGATPQEPDGFWEVNGFGLLGIYKSDLIAAGGMNTHEFTNRWGGEDWELLDRILQLGLEVERLHLRNFLHHYHSKRGMWNRQMLRMPT
ncbi:beta-1,4-N-acetylgalactosaminyltransferase 3 isoform X4 [Alosa sapidissima]|uniref:beta-1,4-N-acetylgalactosaminyltransferase 3 isoform X4 n=1 Tax=Alosa sapidissima TaxID=34773 RepID=UPI001C0A4F74|nr:beta-1,4-N-acetylgalactosaminyltransferase 3 isoform X4 [Alosa sapidissima]